MDDDRTRKIVIGGAIIALALIVLAALGAFA